MKQKLWITLITYLACCIDKELYETIDYLRTQVVEVLIKKIKCIERLDGLLKSYHRLAA